MGTVLRATYFADLQYLTGSKSSPNKTLRYCKCIHLSIYIYVWLMIITIILHKRNSTQRYTHFDSFPYVFLLLIHTDGISSSYQITITIQSSHSTHSTPVSLSRGRFGSPQEIPPSRESPSCKLSSLESIYLQFFVPNIISLFISHMNCICIYIDIIKGCFGCGDKATIWVSHQYPRPRSGYRIYNRNRL